MLLASAFIGLSLLAQQSVASPAWSANWKFLGRRGSEWCEMKENAIEESNECEIPRRTSWEALQSSQQTYLSVVNCIKRTKSKDTSACWESPIDPFDISPPPELGSAGGVTAKKGEERCEQETQIARGKTADCERDRTDFDRRAQQWDDAYASLAECTTRQDASTCILQSTANKTHALVKRSHSQQEGLRKDQENLHNAISKQRSDTKMPRKKVQKCNKDRGLNNHPRRGDKEINEMERNVKLQAQELKDVLPEHDGAVEELKECYKDRIRDGNDALTQQDRRDMSPLPIKSVSSSASRERNSSLSLDHGLSKHPVPSFSYGKVIPNGTTVLHKRKAHERVLERCIDQQGRFIEAYNDRVNALNTALDDLVDVYEDYLAAQDDWRIERDRMQNTPKTTVTKTVSVTQEPTTVTATSVSTTPHTVLSTIISTTTEISTSTITAAPVILTVTQTPSVQTVTVTAQGSGNVNIIGGKGGSNYGVNIEVQLDKCTVQLQRANLELQNHGLPPVSL